MAAAKLILLVGSAAALAAALVAASKARQTWNAVAGRTAESARRH